MKRHFSRDIQMAKEHENILQVITHYDSYFKNRRARFIYTGLSTHTNHDTLLRRRKKKEHRCGESELSHTDRKEAVSTQTIQSFLRKTANIGPGDSISWWMDNPICSVHPYWMINRNGVLIHTARMKLGNIQPHGKGDEISGCQGTRKGRECGGLLAVQGSSLGHKHILELVMMVKTMIILNIT